MIEAILLPIQIKPVLGKGREERWKAFQEIFKKAFGNNNDLMKNATTRTDLRYRLIVEKEGGKPIGVLIFSHKLSNSFQKLFRLESTLRIQALHLFIYNENFGEALIKFASLNNAKSILANISKKDASLKDFMGRIGFTKIKNLVTNDSNCYSYVLGEKVKAVESSKKETDEKPFEPNPKVRKVEIEQGE